MGWGRKNGRLLEAKGSEEASSEYGKISWNEFWK